MNVQKEYKRGGFFGNSQDRFSDMEGAGKGINTAYKGFLGGKGSALRREKRYLKKLERQGKLNDYGTQSMDRLNYLKKVQKDRGKKIAAGAALAAGTALTAGALAGAAGGAAGAGAAGAATGATGAAAGGAAAGTAAGAAGAGAAGAGAAGAAGGAGLSGVGGAAAKMTLGDKILKALKIGKAGKDLIAPNQNQMTPEQEAQQEQDLMEGVNEAGGNYNYGYGGYEMGGKMRLMKEGGLVGGQKRLDKNNDGRLSREDFELLRAMFGAKLPR